MVDMLSLCTEESLYTTAWWRVGYAKKGQCEENRCAKMASWSQKDLMPIPEPLQAPRPVCYRGVIAMADSYRYGRKSVVVEQFTRGCVKMVYESLCMSRSNRTHSGAITFHAVHSQLASNARQIPSRTQMELTMWYNPPSVQTKVPSEIFANATRLTHVSPRQASDIEYICHVPCLFNAHSNPPPTPHHRNSIAPTQPPSSTCFKSNC